MTILVLSSFLPFLLSLLVRVGARWRPYLLAFPLGMLLVHLFAMGLRWQFVPVYTLALGILVIFPLSSLKISFPNWLIVIGRISLVILLGLALLLNWILPDIRLPVPTGPDAVGTTLEQIDDVELRLWYPAHSQTNVPHYHYLEGVSRSFLGMPSFSYSHLQTKATTALTNPPIASTSDSYPVIVYVHGADSFAEDNTFRLMELASQGFIVAAIEHPKPFKDYGITAAMAQDPKLFSERLVTRVLPDRVRDLRLALQKIEALNADASQFQGKLKLDYLGFLGFSFGGSVASEYCLADVRCRVIVNLDGSSFGDARNGVNVAFLQLSQSAIVPIEPMHNPQTLAEKAGAYYQQEVSDLLAATHRTHVAHWLQVKGTGHAAFTDFIFWTPVRIGPLAMILGDGNPHLVAQAINTLAVSFFRENLLSALGFQDAFGGAS